ncbi:hypothetical protein BOX15_Mlig031692g2, partial [Macrostomum lignano]
QAEQQPQAGRPKWKLPALPLRQCKMCGDGCATGALIQCDLCPAAQHLACLGLERPPPSGLDFRCPAHPPADAEAASGSGGVKEKRQKRRRVALRCELAMALTKAAAAAPPDEAPPTGAGAAAAAVAKAAGIDGFLPAWRLDRPGGAAQSQPPVPQVVKDLYSGKRRQKRSKRRAAAADSFLSESSSGEREATPPPARTAEPLASALELSEAPPLAILHCAAPAAGGPPVALTRTGATVGLLAGNDIALAEQWGSDCVYAAASCHATIHYDPTGRVFELINYSQHGTVVDGQLFAPSAKRTWAAGVGFSGAKDGQKGAAKSAAGRRGGGLTGSAQRQSQSAAAATLAALDSAGHRFRLSGGGSGGGAGCRCLCSPVALFGGGGGGGCEDGAVLRHGSIIQIGCVLLVFVLP